MTDETHETLGLRTLEDITTLILHSHDLQETLDNIVNLVAKTMHSDVCSIYLLEDDGETLTLKATRGLSRSSVGKVQMKTSEGLTGLTVEQRGVVATDNAPLHPRYKYFRETKEERFQSFLGLPLFEGKAPMGAIIIQTRESRSFSDREISTLTTIAYQISSIIINAKLLYSIHKKEEERAFFEKELAKIRGDLEKADSFATSGQRKGKHPAMSVGIPVSSGFSIGRISIIRRGTRNEIELERVGTRQEERRRFQLALEKARIQTLYLKKRVAQNLSEEDASIFHTHLMILEDRGFISKIQDLIDKDNGVAQAVYEVVSHYVSAFANMADPYLRERSADMEDIGRRIVDCLDGAGRKHHKLRDKRIIVAKEILPSDLATLDSDKILGIITERGDVNSHASIMAKSLGIPAVVGISGLLSKVNARDEAIIDGNTGNIYINPDKTVKGEYERLQHDFSLKRQELAELHDQPAVTTDGARIILKANIGLLSDIRIALTNGAEGVGLYRTEFPYMARTSFPDRQTQFRLYRKVVEGFHGLPVTIRTLDIGGDKGLPYFDFPQEANPFLGWRSIRVSLDRKDIFRTQLAAILMASPYGKVSLMFPMISSIDEIRDVAVIMDDVRDSLSREGYGFDPEIRCGIMIEIPAAVQIADILIKETDFFSIGTNDLIQYTMAADRNNPKVRSYYDACHPAVLHSIKRVVDIAHSAGKPVSLCGEMAAEPIHAVLLVGMGISEFSLAAPAIPLVKKAIRSVGITRAREIAKTALALDRSADIKDFLAEEKNILRV